MCIVEMQKKGFNEGEKYHFKLISGRCYVSQFHVWNNMNVKTRFTKCEWRTYKIRTIRTIRTIETIKTSTFKFLKTP